jgi:hypothetical protein
VLGSSRRRGGPGDQEERRGLFGFGKVQGEQVFARGERANGRIAGIEVTETRGEHNVRVDEYAVEVAAASVFTAGVNQRLRPDDAIRLGMPVVVRHLDGNAVIDWPATCDGDPGIVWAATKKPPAPGIVDNTLGLDKARRKGTRASASIDRASVENALFGMAQMLQLDLTVRPEGLEAYLVEVKKVKVPHYATHLCLEGTVLPVWVNPDRLDRVTIDWPVAAMTDPGIGRPLAEILAEVGNVFSGKGPATSAMTVADDRPIAADVSGGHVPIDGVSFDMWVAVGAGLARDRVAPGDYDSYAQQHGVRPGAWAGAESGWQRRMMTDWRLGAAYGEAFEAARKRR